VKVGISVTKRRFSDKTAVSKFIVNKLENIALKYGFTLNKEQVSII
jgi:hypothetical protein